MGLFGDTGGRLDWGFGYKLRDWIPVEGKYDYGYLELLSDTTLWETNLRK